MQTPSNDREDLLVSAIDHLSITDQFPKAIVRDIPRDSLEWEWQGKRWQPTLSGDGWQRKLLGTWPDARPCYHRAGRRWYVGDLIVGELRPKGGWPQWEAWELGREVQSPQ